MKHSAPNQSVPRSCPRLVTLAMAALVWVGSASAAEMTVRNDSFESGQSSVVVGDFAVGEEAGAWLTSPCNGNIVAVQIGWLSGTGGGTISLQENIWVRQSGTFPVPGGVLLQLEGPVMTPGAINEFRYIDEQQTIPISIPVSSGQTFVVSIEFGEPTDVGNGGASVFRDVNGCQAGRNVLYGNIGFGNQWYNFCLFLAGDLVIRAVVDCEATTGACCLPSGLCQNNQTPGQCSAAEGTYQGNGTTCGGVNCPQPTGACCLPDGECLNGQASSQCAAANGAYQGNNTNCGGVTCPDPVGACCLGPDACLDLTLDDCALIPGQYEGDGTECDTTVCFPMGACCYPDGSCGNDVSPDDCEGDGGIYQGNDTLCSGVSCPQPVGACCLSNGNCLNLTSANCAVISGSTWAGPGTACGDANMDGTHDACKSDEGIPGDLDGDGDVDLVDFSTLSVCFSGAGGARPDSCSPADFALADLDGDGDVDLIDFSTFQTNFGT